MLCAKTCAKSCTRLLSRYSHGGCICPLLIQNKPIGYLSATLCMISWMSNPIPSMTSLSRGSWWYLLEALSWWIVLLLTILFTHFFPKSINCRVKEASKETLYAPLLLWWGLITYSSGDFWKAHSQSGAGMAGNVILIVALVLPSGTKKVVVSEKFPDEIKKMLR